MNSSVPAFMAALITRLEADPKIDTSKVKVSWGNPNPANWPRTVVIFGPVTNRKREYVAARTQANETYDVAVRINRTGPPQNLNPVNMGAVYDLEDIVRESLRLWTNGDAPMVSGSWGTANIADDSLEFHDEEGVDETGRDASTIGSFSVTARLI